MDEVGPIRRYAVGKPLTVHVRQESEGKQPQWYAHTVSEVPGDHPDMRQPASKGAVGVDRNVGQATDSTEAKHTIPDTTVDHAKIKRYQRKFARQKGTVKDPGRNVKQKAGLNRTIPASGRGPLERKLAYKAGDLLFVDPAYTSRTCSRGGHTAKSNRPQCGDQYPGAGGTARTRSGPRGRGCRTAVVNQPNNPPTRLPGDGPCWMVPSPSGR